MEHVRTFLWGVLVMFCPLRWLLLHRCAHFVKSLDLCTWWVFKFFYLFLTVLGSSLWCLGFSLLRLLFLQSTGSRARGASVAVVHELSSCGPMA